MSKPGGQPNLQQLMKQAQKMQQQLAVAQEKLAQTTVQGSAGGGLVTATMTGGGELTGLSIEASVVDPSDVDTLTDLVISAVQDAHRAASELQASTMGPIAGGAPGLPGLGA